MEKVKFADFYNLYSDFLKTVLKYLLLYFNAISSIFIVGLSIMNYTIIFSNSVQTLFLLFSLAIILSVSLIIYNARLNPRSLDRGMRTNSSLKENVSKYLDNKFELVNKNKPLFIKPKSKDFFIYPPYINFLMSFALSVYLGSLLFSNLNNFWITTLLNIDSVYVKIGEVFFYAIISAPIFIFGVFVLVKIVEGFGNKKLFMALIFSITMVLIFSFPFVLFNQFSKTIFSVDFLYNISTNIIKILIGAVPFTWIYALFVKKDLEITS